MRIDSVKVYIHKKYPTPLPDAPHITHSSQALLDAERHLQTVCHDTEPWYLLHSLIHHSNSYAMMHCPIELSPCEKYSTGFFQIRRIKSIVTITVGIIIPYNILCSSTYKLTEYHIKRLLQNYMLQVCC